MEPICTVLLISYNHSKYIRKCLDSVLAQKTKYNYIIKIFDDCSTDGTQEIIREYEQNYPDKIKIFINKENIGQQTNIWNAYQSVDTKYCIYTETDDYWCDNNKIEMQIEALENHPECSFCCTNYIINTLQDGYVPHKTVTQEIDKNTYKKDIINFEYVKNLAENYIPHLSTRCIRMSSVELNSIKNKETFLYDISQFYWLLHKGNMFWIDKVCSVYQKTGYGIWTSSNPSKRLSLFWRGLADFNEDTEGIYWEKIAQQLILVSRWWLYLNNCKNDKYYKLKRALHIHYYIPNVIWDLIDITKWCFRTVKQKITNILKKGKNDE